MVELNEYMGFIVGDVVTRIEGAIFGDSDRIIVGEPYTIIKINTRNTQSLYLRGSNTTGWWTHHSVLTHMVKGLCRNCSNTCKRDGLSECPFYSNNGE